MNEILLVNKKSGVTSRDVVNDLVHIFHTKKIGHTGTLDPLATGILICLIGKYTKLGNDITCTYKEYEAEMKLGIITDTYDIEGKVLERNKVDISEDTIRETIMSFKREYLQEVPIYSSVKINGRKLYDYARSGDKVILPSREVDIKELEILSINGNIIKFRCLVSKGTYIRSLINDIGISLECGAIMTKLTRTKQGRFDVKCAYTIDEIREGKYSFTKLEDVIDLVKVDCTDDMYKQVKNGIRIVYDTNLDYILFKHNNLEVSLYKRVNDDNSINNTFEMYIYLEEE
jgi:tRNA pseudouridine55 synthase